MPNKDFSPEGDPFIAYRRAYEEWDRRIGSQAVQAQNWRRIAFGAVALAFISVLILAVEVKNVKVVPFLVTSEDKGNVVNVFRILPREIPAPQITYAVGHYIENMRTIPIDAEIYRRNLLKCVGMSEGNARENLRQYVEGNDLFALVGKINRYVEIKSVLPISPDTYVVGWVETETSHVEKEPIKREYSAKMTVRVRMPTTEKDVIENPLGIYVVDIILKEVLDGQKTANSGGNL